MMSVAFLSSSVCMLKSEHTTSSILGHILQGGYLNEVELDGRDIRHVQTLHHTFRRRMCLTSRIAYLFYLGVTLECELVLVVDI